MLITMSPDFFANHLLSLGIDVVRASTFPPLPFRAAVDPGILTPADKAPRRCWPAVGDPPESRAPAVAGGAGNAESAVAPGLVLVG
jgi:hypothetical protein